AGERAAATVGLDRFCRGSGWRKSCNVLAAASPQAAIMLGPVAPDFARSLGNNARTTASQKTIRTRKNIALPALIDRCPSCPDRFVFFYFPVAAYRIEANPR